MKPQSIYLFNILSLFYMTTTFLNQGNDDPLQDEAFVAQLINTLIRMQHAMEENKQLKQRVEALETENAALDGEAQPAPLQGQVHHHYASSRRHAQAELPPAASEYERRALRLRCVHRTA